MAYTPIGWLNDQAPAINAANLNQMDNELVYLDKKCDELETEIEQNNYTPIYASESNGLYTGNIGEEYGFQSSNAWRCEKVPVIPERKYRVSFSTDRNSACYYMFVDNSGVILSQFVQNYGERVEKTVLADCPTRAAYILVNAAVNNDTNTYLLEVAESITDVLDESRDNIDITEDRLPILPYAKISQKNIFYPANSVSGYLESDGTITSSGSYKTSAFIYVPAGRTLTISPTVRKFIAYSNVSENKIISFVNDETVGAYTFSAAVDSMIRFSYRVGNEGLTQAEYGNTATTYEQPLGYLDDNVRLVESQLNQIKNEISDDLPYVGKWQKNLLNPSDAVSGYLNADGSIHSGGSYKTSALIHVPNGESITISPSVRKFIAFSDSAGTTVISGTFVTDETTGPYTYTASTDSYIKFTYRVGNEGITQAEYGTTATEYTPPVERIEENVYFSDTLKEEIKGISSLTGKKWCPCGDSFSEFTNATFTDGQFSGKFKTYPRLIALRTGINLVETFFASGRTLAFPAEPGTFVNSLTCPNKSYNYQNIPADTDIVTIYLGINDHHHATGGGDGEDPTGYIPLGTIMDGDPDGTEEEYAVGAKSYYGAWNTVLSWLIENRPNTHIGIIVTNGIAGDDNYRLAQIAIAKKYGIPYIDLNGDERTPTMSRTSNPNIPARIKSILLQKWSVDPDGSQTGTVNTHANYQAHAFESVFIEEFLKSL